jgi:hypothetical protein
MLEKVRLAIDSSSMAFIHGNKENCRESIYEHLESLCKQFETDEFNFISEDRSSNFRNEVAVTNEYKGQRRTPEKEALIASYLPHLDDCFREINTTFKATTYLGVENDDVISILATRLPNLIMCANDVDYLATPGTYYNIKTNKATVIRYPGKLKLNGNKVYATGYYQTYIQLLKGSPKENYKGIEGMGSVGAYDALKNLTTEDEMKQVCTQLFVDRYGLEDGIKKLEEGFRLSWILTHNASLVTPKPIKLSELNI